MLFCFYSIVKFEDKLRILRLVLLIILHRLLHHYFILWIFMVVKVLLIVLIQHLDTTLNLNVWI